jgi:cyclic pyranopterin phosphate synthase
MVDVGAKPVQRRIACATGTITLSKEARRLVARNQLAKGDVLAVAHIAGIQAAKRTGELVPLCHPLAFDLVDVQLKLTRSGVSAFSEVRGAGRTGFEMEALTAVSVALLTVYDMCKAVDKTMEIGAVRLLSKEKHDVPAL